MEPFIHTRDLPFVICKLQKLKNLGLYYNSPEPAIIYIKCGFAINPIRMPHHLGDKHYITKSACRGSAYKHYNLRFISKKVLLAYIKSKHSKDIKLAAQQ
ncbi:hypothetical protein QL093DRAFT_2565545 [Fusarium oxysporum]|nr:hypothetical protein QL093DRAFT_2565545 [Fusarium oxysporum]